MPRRVLVAWSSGKDSAWTLQVLRAQPQFEVAGLFTTVHEDGAEVAVHAVPTALLELQARAAGLPLHKIAIPRPCPNEAYEAAILGFARRASAQGITHFAFGDLFLEDIRRYRERLLAGGGVAPLFPLWGMPTRELAAQMTRAGLRAWIVCVDPKQAPRAWAGKLFDPGFVARVPEGIDPCGERGEFHTFASAGPMFAAPIPVRVGGVVERDGFVYAGVAAEV